MNFFRNHRFSPFDSYFPPLLFQRCPKRTRSGLSVLCAVSKGTDTPPARHLFPCFRSRTNTWKVQQSVTPSKKLHLRGFSSCRRLKQRSDIFCFVFFQESPRQSYCGFIVSVRIRLRASRCLLSHVRSWLSFYLGTQTLSRQVTLCVTVQAGTQMTRSTEHRAVASAAKRPTHDVPFCSKKQIRLETTHDVRHP